MSDRAELETSRAYGLRKRHETRLKRAIRREVAEDIAQALLDFEANDNRGRADMSIDRAVAIAREIGSKETQ